MVTIIVYHRTVQHQHCKLIVSILRPLQLYFLPIYTYTNNEPLNHFRYVHMHVPDIKPVDTEKDLLDHQQNEFDQMRY